MRRSGIRSISEKRKAQLKAKGPTRRAWINRTTKGAKRKGRTPSETLRIYGPPERRAWIKARPCVVACGQVGACENAHVGRVGAGAGRKGDASQIAPMHPSCHAELHRIGRLSFETLHSCDLQALADFTEHCWIESRKDGNG